MIRAVIIDFWGVLCPDAYAAWQVKYVANLPAHQSELDMLSRRSDLGELALRDFYAALGKLSGQSVPKVIETMGDLIRPYDDVVATLRSLKGDGLLVGLLSNSPVSLHDTVTELQLDDCFDAILTSAEAGACKPSPDFFAQIIQRLGIARDQAIFFDDRILNVEGAQAYGLAAYRFVDGKGFDATLKQALDSQA